MKQYLRFILSAMVMIIFCCLPSLVNAQPGPGCDPAVDPTCVPIDGGLSFLIAAGVVYGVKKVRDGRKQKQAEQNL